VEIVSRIPIRDIFELQCSEPNLLDVHVWIRLFFFLSFIHIDLRRWAKCTRPRVRSRPSHVSIRCSAAQPTRIRISSRLPSHLHSFRSSGSLPTRHSPPPPPATPPPTTRQRNAGGVPQAGAFARGLPRFRPEEPSRLRPLPCPPAPPAPPPLRDRRGNRRPRRTGRRLDCSGRRGAPPTGLFPGRYPLLACWLLDPAARLLLDEMPTLRID